MIQRNMTRMSADPLTQEADGKYKGCFGKG